MNLRGKGRIFGLLTLALIGGLCLYFSGFSFVSIQAGSADIEEIINLAQSPVNGEWQPTNNLWKLKNTVDLSSLPGSPLDNNEYWIRVPEYDNLGMWVRDRKEKSQYLNNTNGEDNLSQNAFANPPDRWSSSEGFVWSLSRNQVVQQKPFLVVGRDKTEDQHGNPITGAAFTNEELKLNLWIPESVQNITSVKLQVSNFCDNTAWDINGNSGKTELYIIGKDGQEQSLTDSESPRCNQSTIDIPSTVGPSFDDKKPFIYAEKDNVGTITTITEQNYRKYEISARVTEHDPKIVYNNQFQLKVLPISVGGKQVNGYLGIGETERNTDYKDYTAESALSISNRLPEDYKRLLAYWQTTIYIATNAEKGCSGSENGFIGLYDSDYRSASIRPRIEIRESKENRNGFWETFGGNSFPANSVKYEFEFDGKNRARQDVSQDEWEYSDEKGKIDGVPHQDFEDGFTFQRNKIYKLDLYGITQRTWIQIGLPYDQLNALQKCVEKPLVKVHYADVSAGGRFGMGVNINACSNAIDDGTLSATNIEGGIYTHAFEGGSSNTYAEGNGSSAEYAVRANDEIIGFHSNFKQNAVKPAGYRLLTFANNSQNDWGGNFNDRGRCIPNYWRRVEDLKQEDATISDVDASSFSSTTDNTEKFYKPDSGELTLTNNIVNNYDLEGLKATIYVEGDLIIEDNLVNNENNQWETFNQIGYIYLIVKGDILIDPSVTQIDAILVAYPNNEDQDDSSKGRIYTCYHSATVDSTTVDINAQGRNDQAIRTASDSYHTACGSPLVVNGALIGRKIHLGRTTRTEKIGNDLIVAEEINLMPEYFVGTPQLPSFAEWLYNADSITILPPNF